MKKIIILLFLIVIVLVILLNFFNVEVKNSFSENKKADVSNKILNNSFKTQLISNNDIFGNREKIIKNKEETVYNKNENFKNDFDKKTNEYVFTNKTFEKFKEKNDLKEIDSVGNIKIYARNFSQKENFSPPMPPILIEVKFKNEKKIIPLKSNLINANKKIYIINKTDNKVEVKEIEVKNLSSFMPPQIGKK